MKQILKCLPAIAPAVSRLSQRGKARFVMPALFATLVGSAAFAQTLDQAWGVYGQIGTTIHGSRNSNDVTLGFVAPLLAPRDWWNGQFSGYWDGFISEWHAPSLIGGGRSSYTQLGVIPTLRYRLDGGQSRWFADAGLGLTYLDKIYSTPDRSFSSRFQFSEVLGVGRIFGAQGQYELGLRFQHFSNAGITEPNPGENFVQLRFVAKF